MAIFKDRTVSVPRVKGITINRGDKNKVLYVHSAPYDASLGYTKPKRTVIGYISETDTKRMYPTDKFRDLFPGVWESEFKEKPKAIIKKMGMYTLGQAVNQKIGIKDVLEQTLGKSISNKLMDYALYSILYSSDVTSKFSSRMQNQVLYSSSPYSDSDYSNLFENQLKPDDWFEFQKEWVKQCKQDGVDDVWLSIDGSNDDCESTGIELAEKGHAKSGKNKNIVSFTHAVTTKGKPVAFDVYRGGLVDSKALKRITTFLKEYGIRIKGVILDRGYCDSKVLKYLNENNIAYIIMVKGQPRGLKDTAKMYGNDIKMNANYWLEGSNLFAIKNKCQLFELYEKEDYVTLFFDHKKASDRVERLLKNLYKEMLAARKKIANGEELDIAKKYKNLLSVHQTGPQQEISINTENLQKEIDEKGLYSIVSNEDKSPLEIHELYSSRNASELQYKFIKNQLGYGKARVHLTNGVYSKFALGFIASIIRYEIEQAAKTVERSTTEIIGEMNLLEMAKVNNAYTYVHIENYRQLEVLKQLDADAKILDSVVEDENNRVFGLAPVPRHRKPGPNRKKQIGVDKTSKIRKKPGPKKGYIRSETNKDGSLRQKPGPKLGSKKGEFNKDGSQRQKPGPKSKNSN